MHVSLKSLLVTGLLALSTINAQAEWQPNIPTSMMPITWGDCIPVPINTAPAMPNMPMGGQQAMGAQMPFFGSAPSMNSMNMPMNMNAPIPFPPAPPSPFYGDIPVIPLPLEANLQCPPAIDDGSKKKLTALQAHYDKASEASRNKIEELKQILNDTQNQLQDSVASVGALTKSKESSSAQISEIKKRIEALGKSSVQMVALKEKENSELIKHVEKLDSAGNSIKQQLETLEKEKEALQNKLTIASENLIKKESADKTNIDNLKNKIESLTKTSQEMLSLKEKENAALKKHLAELDNAGNGIQQQLIALGKEKDSLQKQLTLASEKSGQQAQKLMAFGQSADNINVLKKQLVAMTKTNDDMQLQLQASLKQSSAKLNAIQNAHSLQGKENQALKKQLDELNAANKNMHVQIGALKTDTTDKNKQLLAFKGAESQEADLKKQLTDLNVAYQSLQAQSVALKAEAAGQNKALLGLQASSNKLGLLQQAFSTQEATTAGLKSQLALCANAKNELESCNASVDGKSKKLVASLDNGARLKEQLDQLKIKSESQAKEISGLMATADELNKVKADLAKATADTDKDGVVDTNDKCPASPSGSAVNAEGCPKVVEPAKVVEAVVPPPAPEPVKNTDADNDGVADDNDLCPTSEAGVTVNEFGCKASEKVTLEGVTFKLGSAQLKSSSLAVLDVAAKSLVGNPGLKIEIEGHTDNQGWTGANKRLSQRRANTVMIYLIKKGVKAETLSAKGFGESQPIMANDTPEGRAKNRRVDLKILK